MIQFFFFIVIIIMIKFFQIQHLYCMNANQSFNISYLKESHSTSTSYPIYDIQVKNRSWIVSPFVRIRLNMSPIMKVIYKIYNQFDRTFFYMENPYMQRRWNLEIKDNYFLFPVEVLNYYISLPTHNNQMIHIPCRLELIPKRPDKETNWFLIGNRSDYCFLRLHMEDIHMQIDHQVKKTIIVFFFSPSIHYYHEHNSLILFGNQMKEFFYWSIMY